MIMEKTPAGASLAPLLTGIIGEAVLELIDLGRNVSREDIVIMLEKKKRACELPTVARVIDDALFWMRKGASS
jgi:hypothetical protein